MAQHADQVGRSLAMRLSCTRTIRLETEWGVRGGGMEGCRRVVRRSGGDMARMDAWKAGILGEVEAEVLVLVSGGCRRCTRAGAEVLVSGGCRMQC